MSAHTCAASEDHNLLGPLDDGHLDCPRTEKFGGRRDRILGGAAPDTPRSSESAANEDEAMPDVEDLGGSFVPSRASRTQSAELARILDRGEEFRKAMDENPPGGRPDVNNLRLDPSNMACFFGVRLSFIGRKDGRKWEQSIDAICVLQTCGGCSCSVGYFPCTMRHRSRGYPGQVAGL